MTRHRTDTHLGEKFLDHGLQAGIVGAMDLGSSQGGIHARRPGLFACFSDLERRLHQPAGMSDPAVMEPKVDRASSTGQVAAALKECSTWEQAEGSPLPLGVTWIEEEQAYNFALHAEHAESVTLLLYAPPTWSIRS